MTSASTGWVTSPSCKSKRITPSISIADPFAAFNVSTAGGMACIGSFFKIGWRFTNEIRVVVYYSSFFLFYLYLIFHGPLFFAPRKLPPYCRSERNTGNKSTQHSWTQQGNLLCTSCSWHYQIAVCTKSWASSFCPLYMLLVAVFLALSERSGRHQPPAERSPISKQSIY